jgi:hypothetical protein
VPNGSYRSCDRSSDTPATRPVMSITRAARSHGRARSAVSDE